MYVFVTKPSSTSAHSNEIDEVETEMTFGAFKFDGTKNKIFQST